MSGLSQDNVYLQNAKTKQLMQENADLASGMALRASKRLLDRTGEQTMPLDTYDIARTAFDLAFSVMISCCEISGLNVFELRDDLESKWRQVGKLLPPPNDVGF